MREWLDAKHPIYRKHEKDWVRDERRLRGGAGILTELVPFDWEDEKLEDGHYAKRQGMANYINFADMFATTAVGHLTQKAPQPGAGLDFGTLGEVRRIRNQSRPTPAELVYWNVDGVGNDGSQWDNWWASVTKRAMATGHRWIYVEAPAEEPRTLSRLMSGLRPYLTELSPLAVTNWHFRRGRLEFAVIRLSEREPEIRDGKLSDGPDQPGYLLLVRRGYSALDVDGTPYSVGGWFKFDGDRQLIDFGDWGRTNGEIPLFPYFYERDPGARDDPDMSRSALTFLGQLGVSFMNLDSAADFDAWDAAKSEKYVLGADPDGWSFMMRHAKAGSTLIPIPVNAETQQAPQLVDGSTGAVTAEVFEKRLMQKMAQAREMSARELTSVPESSGRSKQVGAELGLSPRLALQASELEQAQTTAIYFLESRFGAANPSGSVEWPRRFEISPLISDVMDIFELERISGLRSATLGKKAMVMAAKEKGFIADDTEAAAIEKEYEESAGQRNINRAAENALFAELNA